MDKNKKQLMARNFTASKLALFTCSALATGVVSAGDLEIRPRASSELIFQQIDSAIRGDRDVTTLRIEPSVDAVYTAKRASASANITATHLERDTDAFSSRNDFLEYQYEGELDVIERLLTIGVLGRSRYLNANTNNFLISDQLTNSNDLTRTQTDTIRASSDFTRNPLIEARTSVSFSKVQAEESQFRNTGRLNNETFEANANITDGSAIQGFKWELDGMYSDTDRSEANLGTFETHEVDGFVDRLIYGRWAFRVTGWSESYEFRSQGNFIQDVREFDSYGGGITYYKAEDRYISLTVNKANSSNPENDGDVFPGVDVNWAFTNRTNISARYGQRFYGDATNLRISHATRKIRTSVFYSEDVRNASQFLGANNTDGVLVCPGSGFSPGCFQPDTLAYELTGGQQFIQLGEDNNVIDDSIILRKGGGFEMSYQSRVFTVGIFARYNDDNFLGQQRRRKTESFGTNGTYRIGAFTRLNAALSFADIERDDDLLGRGTGENMRFNLGLNHRFSPHLNLNAGYSFVEQEGGVSLGGFGSNYTENRFQVGVTYIFR